jgi:Ca2+-binding RTX toxin-like protein
MVKLIRSDLNFILQQIMIAEQHAAGATLDSLLPNSVVPFGLRTVTGQFNNLFPGQSQFGAADTLFPRALTPSFRTAEMGTSYLQTAVDPNINPMVDPVGAGFVIDSQPRTISNLIVDQSVTLNTGDTNNLAAYATAYDPGPNNVLDFNGIAGDDVLKDGVQIIDATRADGTPVQTFQFLNTTPDEGLSAPFNAWFTFFGQFFDHGLDLLTKGGSGTVFIPLQQDDPLFSTAPDARNFMAVTRATNQPGPDGVVGTDDDIHEHENTTSPFVDQNQTYSSHPSHQVFLRAYAFNGAGDPVSTGKLIEGSPTNGGMANWAQVKAQALAMLGITLTDHDVHNVPLLATDDYGKFIPDPVTGFAQVVVRIENGPGTADDILTLVSGTPANPVDLNDPLGDGSGTVVRTGHAFLNDIAHHAAPGFVDTNRNGVQDAGEVLQTPDLDAGPEGLFGDDHLAATYDNELLDAHFIAGDGRVNENIGLTAVHAIFHSEHNRLVEHTQDVAIADAQKILAEQLAAGATPAAAQAAAVLFLNNWLVVDVTSVPATPAAIAALVWDGERLFQAAKFGTEMQYQHLVFEEFARKVQPMVDVFLAPEGFDTTINPAIVAEFAHVVYRFGHSMLTETVDRFQADFSLVGGDTAQIGLIQAFLNPLEFVASGNTPEQSVGNIVRGLTRTQGNEIDEFVTEALRNNLVGLPLDLPAINIARGRDTGVPSLNAARREFYAMTADGQLKPYTSWADLSQHLKHPASLMNFIAAYGTHVSILSAITLADKRAAAYALVYGEGGMDGDVATTGDNTSVLFPLVTIPGEADRLAFLNSTGIYANQPNGVTTTGVDDIDLWIGGLAEKQMPFGGLLGSTFNFVFETQMENLQNSDRFYYLARLAGLNLLTEMENNSFAKLIMRNTDVVHLPAEVFTTPAFTLEVNSDVQFTGLGLDGRDDPEGGTALTPLVIRDNPATAGPDGNYLRYTGVDHVVLGGTAGNDILIASIGDDTIWGDGGNDRIEGGDGVDNVEAGTGDDIITDKGGDDVLKGNEGNDVISGGNGFNLILGGDGSDFIITGEDVSETFAGGGNDFILGAQMNLPTFGNEGDDWIEIGTSDGAGGDNFDPQEASTIIGHDVFITGGGFDEADGEGGDDIMVFSDGEDHFGGGGGFDWASYANDPLGVTADLLVNDLIEPPVTPSNQGIRDRFAEVEGLSGSKFSDVLRGDNAGFADIATADALNGELTRVSLIANLQAFLGEGVASFSTGNIILGGDGSDIIEGRGGDDLIDGDLALNVRISVRDGFTAAGPNATEIASFASMSDPTLLTNMLNGTWNPGQLQIVREILSPTTAGPDFDTAVYSGQLASFYDTDGNPATAAVLLDDYDIVTVGGVTTVTHLVRDALGVIVPGAVGIDGIDRLTNIERLQFSPNPAAPAGTPDATGTVVLVPGLNAGPVGLLTLNTPNLGTLSVSATLVTDADNVSATNLTGAITGNPIAFIWQAERDPVNAPGIFTDIVGLGGAQPETAHGNTFRITADLNGLLVRARAVYQDANGVLETVYSGSTIAVAAAAPTAPAAPEETLVNSPGNGVHLIRADLQFMLDQIVIAENHSGAYGTPSQGILDQIANSRLPFGLRTVDGTFNNLVQGQTNFAAADQNFPLLLDQVFLNDADGDIMPLGPPGSGAPTITNNNYASTVSVADADPRIISNLIVDQTITNPVAVQAFIDAGSGILVGPLGSQVLHYLNDDGTTGVPVPANTTLTLLNVTPDEGLSAGFNGWFTFFGQFFDHGLDLVDKGGAGTIYMPLMEDDPLFVVGGSSNFMVLTRATNSAVNAGLDGVLGTPDDVHFHNNETTPFIDQNQTYTSNASHQVFLREYTTDGLGRTVTTGRLIDGLGGGIGNWAEVKAQAASMLGIQLIDMNIFDVPLLATDAYGKFIPGANGFAQFVTTTGLVPANPADNGGLGTLVPANALFTGHAFLNDIAHNAVPGTVFDTDGNPATPGTSVVQADDDDIAGNVIATDFRGRKIAYDDELLDAHKITGDGRGNENIGLTAVHFIFHAEHNRMVGHLQDVAAASNDASFLNNWLIDGITQAALDAINALAPAARTAAIEALNWNGERLFQAARFSTEMQYQHLVFEEFARKVQPQVDIFLMEGQGYDSTINPAIVAEFAHVVYRFGHSLLPDTIDRLDANFVSSEVGLIEAFLNPLLFTASGATDAEAAGAIIRGVTRQAGNEIDELVTEAVRNNLLGLPLDLAAINIARGRDTGVPTLNQARAEFYSWTGDSQLKPYTSWLDFAANLKHEAALVNFIAAYGTHASITLETTTAGKRAAAYALVYGENGIDGVALSGDEPTVAVPADRLDFLNATGAYAPDGVDPNDDSRGGLNNIDLWVGGLAEKQMPFGGLLGSTFNYVFENQMEKLQNGDRFYYLERTAGLNFLTELENNSFAKLIMANTNTTHLPGDVFSTPAWTLEVNDSVQFTGLGVDGRDDPTEGGSALTPLVIRDNPNTPIVETNYLHYTGVDHVVLGGTSGNDTLIASIGDDTLYGDAGHDRLDGGEGVDMTLGGAGDDIITDLGGDDNLQGQDGNDAIHGGNGINLILGGFGQDFIMTGEDESEAFGGGGNDFIFGNKPVEMLFGNEGDDWIEHGMADGSSGENFDTRGRDSIIGHDVFMGDTVSDRMLGEGGDDIMVGNGGTGDRYIGSSGFDWASYDHPTFGGEADLNLRAFDETPVPLSPSSVLARFESVEGLSGSAFADILRGDDLDAAGIAASGFTGSVLNSVGINLISGLQGLLNDLTPGNGNVASFGAGNIILGGDGSDILEGRGGNDLIDGDLALNVRISVRATVDLNNDQIADRDASGELVLGAQIATADSMVGILQNKSGALAGTSAGLTLASAVFAGTVNPGQLTVVREILSPTTVGSDFDTAVFANTLFDANNGNAPNYVIRVNGAVIDLGPGPIALPFTIPVGAIVTVEDVGALTEGTDTLRNIERLQFADQSVVINGTNAAPTGLAAIAGTAVEDQVLTASLGTLADADNVGGIITGPVAYFWQVELRPGDGIFTDIIIATGVGDVHASGPTFTPGDAEVGLRLRVRVLYQDANGVIEEGYSAPTAAVANVNDAPVGAPTLSDQNPTQDIFVTALTGGISDVDGLTLAVFSYQWQVTGTPLVEASWANIPGLIGTEAQFAPRAVDVNQFIRVVVTYTDDQGTLETVRSAASGAIGFHLIGNNNANVQNGGAFDDWLQGLGGADTLIGNAGADLLEGGLGADILVGGIGADRMIGGAGNDTYVVEDATDVVIELVGEGNDVVQTALSALTLADNVEILNYTGAGNFAGTGNAQANTITGGAGADMLDGAAGNDTLAGAGGADTLTGGLGADSLSGGADNDTFRATLDDGNDLISGGAGTDTYDLSATSAGATITTTTATSTATGADTLVSIENFIGSQGGDTFTLGGGANAIDGRGGDDTISAGGGADFLMGGAGNDTLVGGTGNDAILGGANNDTINYAFGDGADAVDGGADTDTLAIIGTGGANVLDVAYSGASLTAFEGGTIVNVEAVSANLLTGTDTLSYAGSAAGVTVNLATGIASGFASITSIENVTGTAQADTLTGGAGVNTINGGAGGDILTGGDGQDVINTGAANDDVRDIIRFSTLAELGDTVTNFDATGTTDQVQIGGALKTLLDDGGDPDNFVFASGNGVNGGNTAVDLNGAIEALYLSGANGEGLTTANLLNAAATATEFNAEFALTAADGEATLLVINDTNNNSFAVALWIQAGGGEMTAGELTLIGIFSGNGTVTTDAFDFFGGG